jgi:hypothetical protein
MTAYTEEEAGSCWCPLSGRLWEGEGWECLCIGSNCMMWRWADQRPDWRETRMAGLLPGSPEPKRPDIVRPDWVWNSSRLRWEEPRESFDKRRRGSARWASAGGER